MNRKRIASKGMAALLAAVLTVQMLPMAALAADEAPSEDSSMTLGYAEIDETSGKLWVGNIGETVFDDITYSKESTGDRADKVTLDEKTGKLTAAEGYTLSAEGRPAQAVEFKVDAKYYDSANVLFVENFEGAQEGDTGTGQKFSGTYGRYASGDFTKDAPVRMPIVVDPTKARAGEKSITQDATGSHAENLKASFSGTLTEDAWATMWYYDDGVTAMDTASQYGFMGGIVTKGWTTGGFNGAMGVSYQTSTSTTPPGVYVYRYSAPNSNVNTWASTGAARTEGWHKFQWKIGADNSEMYVDGTKMDNTSPVKRDNFGGFHLVFNWNNMRTPLNNKHYIDSFSLVKADASGNPVAADKTFTGTTTVYVISEDDKPTVTYTQESDNSKGTITIGNLKEIGATLDSCSFTAEGIDGKVTVTPGENDKLGTAEVAAVEGYVLSDKTNPLATKVTVKVTAAYHYGSDTADAETFEDMVEFYYDIDETKTEKTELTGTGERQVIDLNKSWAFGGKDVADASAVNYDTTGWETVDVPHDFNATTGEGSGSARLNGTFWYRKTLTLTEQEAKEYNQRSAYLEFGSVGMEAHVYLNGEEVGSHKGGWSAFNIDVTGKLKAGDNIIAVSADNRRTLNGDIAPLHGDFDNASGINRDVKLVLTSQVHLDQLDYGSQGVYASPKQASGWSESNDQWDVDVTARIANDTVVGRKVTVKATVSHPTSFDDVLGLEAKGLLRFDPKDMYDAKGTQVATETKTLTAVRQSATEAKLTLQVSEPKLWNGMSSPYRYVLRVEVYEGENTDGALLDSYETMIGFRYYDAVRSETYGAEGDGFYLNGKLYPLRGMAFHEDWPGYGRALTKKQIETDVAVLYEMGANWTRVSHYPHNEYCYELLSQYGIACSAEIPLVDGVSLVDKTTGKLSADKQNGKLSPTFKETTLDQFRDMVKQNYNQPAILGWLMQNELGGGTYGQGSGADAKAAQSEMVSALHNLSHELDPGRKTVMAMSLPHCYEFEADWLLWNGYPGWYDSALTGIGYFVDGYANSTAANRQRPTGVSEYGAGVNPFHQADYIRGETSFGGWSGTGKAYHPESYGNDRHEQSLREINARPFYWATGGWIMYDFSASARNEGGRPGINDKGLVYKARPTEVENFSGDPEDLLLRKDGFYLYKANWNPQPMTYIAEQRYNPRLEKKIKVTVYSNAPKVELYQNDKLIGTLEATEHAAYVDKNTVDPETSSCIFKFDVTLATGANHVVAKGLNADGGEHSSYEVTWQYGDPPELDIQSDVFEVINSGKTIVLTGSGNAQNINDLVSPLDPAVEHTYRVLTADQKPVTEGPITAGMILEVTWGSAKKLYTFQQPYISAKKNVTLDGAASEEAAKAVDFKEDTCWEAADTNAHSLVIDLGKRYVLSEIKVNWANTDGASNYNVYTSNDGTTWNKVVDRSDNDMDEGVAQDELQSYGRYVKLDVAAGTAHPRISEIEVYGWMVSVLPGETRIFVDETERTICVPTDIPDFHTGGSLTAGMSIENVEPLLVVEGNCEAVHVNDVDYSLDFEHSKYVVTDSLGRKVSFKFQDFTGSNKPAGPFELAMGKPATCSSMQAENYPATNVTVEDNSRWNGSQQGTSGLDEWVMVDLGAQCTLASVELHFPTKTTGVTSDRSYPFEVYIGASMDSLTQVIDKSSNTDKTGIFTFTDEVKDQTARYVKVKVTGNSTGYQPGLNRLYVKGWAVPPAAYKATLTVNLGGQGYTGHGKTFTLRQGGRTIATGTGADATVEFAGVVDGLYDVYDGENATGVTMDVKGGDASATVNYYPAKLTMTLDGEAYTQDDPAVTLRKDDKVVATGTVADEIDFGALFEGEYLIYAGETPTGATLTVGAQASDVTVECFSVTFLSEGTTVGAQVVAKDCKATKPADPTNGSKTFGGWYADEALTTEWDFDAAAVTEAVKLYAKWTGGSTGGSSGGSSSGSNKTTTTTKNDDGSTTTTVTNKTTGTVTETTKYPDGTKEVVETKKDGTVTETVTDPEGGKVETVTKPDGTVTTTDTAPNGVKTKTVTTSDGETTANVTLPKKVEQAEVTIPTTVADPGVVAVIVQSDGTEKIVKTSVPTEDGVVLTVTESANIKLVDNSKEFEDVPEDHWAKNAVDFASAREIFNGTSEDRFDPSGEMTRAMLATVLYRLEDAAAAGESPFHDVDSGTWYTDAVVWASANGIVTGTGGGQFAPDQAVTREQLATMIYRYVKAMGEDVSVKEDASLAGYSDQAEVSTWSAEAMNWAVSVGLIQGRGADTLAPGGTAMRAEVATIMQRLIQWLAR